jgi:hypothetical protein
MSESLNLSVDSTPKHLRYKRKIKERDLSDDMTVRNILMPKFVSLGLDKVLEVHIFKQFLFFSYFFREKYCRLNSRKP